MYKIKILYCVQNAIAPHSSEFPWTGPALRELVIPSLRVSDHSRQGRSRVGINLTSAT